MTFKCFFISVFLWLTIPVQSQDSLSFSSSLQKDSLSVKWLQELFEMGIEQGKDSIYINEEVIRLVKDPAYRNSIYPDHYDWRSVTSLLEKMELKKAFWHLINIYNTDSTSRPMVIGTFLLYDSLLQMDKMLINTYYTYAFTDPRVCRIHNNKPDIFRPDLLEQHLNITKEIIYNIQFYRQRRKQ
jgi:hypothetical protein